MISTKRLIVCSPDKLKRKGDLDDTRVVMIKRKLNVKSVKECTLDFLIQLRLGEPAPSSSRQPLVDVLHSCYESCMGRPT